MISILILTLISQISGQSISGSISKCGGTGADPVNCGKATVLRGQSHIGIPAACFNKVDPGPCSQDLVRIYYDHKTYTCKAFSYSGCGGNANRFVSIKNCYKLCHPYYRQRFISLGDSGVGQSADNKSNDTNTDNKSKQTDTTTKATTTTEKITTTTPTTTTDDRGVLYFNSIDAQGNPTKTVVKPEIQVVHEYDTFAKPGQNNFGAMSPPMASGHARSLQPGQEQEQTSEAKHGYISNYMFDNSNVGGSNKVPL